MELNLSLQLQYTWFFSVTLALLANGGKGECMEGSAHMYSNDDVVIECPLNRNKLGCVRVKLYFLFGLVGLNGLIKSYVIEFFGC